MTVYKLDVVAENGVPFRVVVLVDGVESWRMDTRTSRTVRDWLYFLVDRESVRV